MHPQPSTPCHVPAQALSDSERPAPESAAAEDTAMANDILLTADQVRRWSDKRSKLLESVAELQAELKEVERKLEAAALITGEALITAAPGTIADEAEEESMTGAILRILKEAGRPLSNKTVRAELSKNPALARRLRRSPNTYYNAVTRLSRRDEVERDVKKGGLKLKKIEASKGHLF